MSNGSDYLLISFRRAEWNVIRSHHHHHHHHCDIILLKLSTMLMEWLAWMMEAINGRLSRQSKNVGILHFWFMCRTYYINISTIGEVEGMKTDRMTVQDGFNSQHKTFLSRQLEIFQLFFWAQSRSFPDPNRVFLSLNLTRLSCTLPQRILLTFNLPVALRERSDYRILKPNDPSELGDLRLRPTALVNQLA